MLVNHAAREINCKIVYCGAGMSGKTTNLQYIYAQTSPLLKGNLISLPTKTERTLYFDFLPLTAGEIRGFKTRFHLYSVPGQIFYDMSRRIILKGVDGIVFVVDSQADRMDANMESFDNLKKNLLYYGYQWGDIPTVIQYNKRDLANVLQISELQSIFNAKAMLHFEAIAAKGNGVFDTLKAIGKLALRRLKDVKI